MCIHFKIKLLLLFLIALIPFASLSQDDDDVAQAELGQLETIVGSLKPDPNFRHDPFILIALQEALSAKREGSGGIGACLVRELTGEIVARGHNRQYSPYFRSDMHAEMDLLNKYEDSLKITKGSRNPRQHDGLVLFSSVEPCPMCLTRIINTGLVKTYYAAPDVSGGMVHKIADLPAYWRDAAAGRIYAAADCSPRMKSIADRLFMHGMGKSRRITAN